MNGLKLALKISKSTLKHLTLHQGLRVSKCINQILTCHSLQSISLEKVAFTEPQIAKLLHMPALIYLQVDDQFESILEILATSNSRLKTLTFRFGKHFSQPASYVNCWSKKNYVPPDLRILVWDISQSDISQLKIQDILSLPPSSSHHDTCLSYYNILSENYIPIHPVLQFSFNPSVSLSMVRAVSPLNRSVFYSEIFSRSIFPGNHFEGKIKFEDICRNITELFLQHDCTIASSELGLFAGLCPNLKNLNIRGCRKILSDLSGLNAIASGCPKLQALDLLDLGRSQVECIDKLWKVMSSMSKLSVLSIPAELVKEKPNCMCTLLPKLTTIYMKGHISHDPENLLLRFLATTMPSLKYFSFTYGHTCTSNISSGIGSLLHSAPNLTHFCSTGGFVLSPLTDPSCYANLQQLYLRGSFVLDHNLADALVQSKNLSVLVLGVRAIAVKEIVKLASSLESLRHFRLSSRQNPGFHIGVTLRAFTRSVIASAKEKGKIIDFEILIGHMSYEFPDWFPQLNLNE